MKPAEIARQYAKDHPEYAGKLTVKMYTGRGKGGRHGLKESRYPYLLRDGVSVRYGSARGRDGFNGFCHVTGEMHTEHVLHWYYLPEGMFATTADVAAELGATRQPEPGRHSWGYAFHPQYRVDWEIEKGIEIEGE